MLTRVRRPLVASMIGVMLSLAIADAGCAQQIISRTNRKDLTLTARIRIAAYQERNHNPNELPKFDTWKFEQTAVVFPILPSTATSDTNDRKVEGELSFNDVVVNDAWKGLLTGYHSGTRLGKWGLVNMSGRELELKVTVPTSCYRTVFNDQAASRAIWPDEWPEEAASTFEPQMFVDLGSNGQPFNMGSIDAMIKKTTGGNPKQVTPVVLAKYLLAQVVDSVDRLDPMGLGFNRNGEIEGIALKGVPVMARTGRGNEFEFVCLLASVYRRAGLPARTVIGWDINEADGSFLQGKEKENKFRAWVEFALYDPQTDGVVWVPVDVIQIWKNRNARPFHGEAWWDEPVKYFGTLDDFDKVVPFAFQFHPPTHVRSYGSAGFWGWMMLPESPDRAYQSIYFFANSTAQRAGDRRNRDGGEE